MLKEFVYIILVGIFVENYVLQMTTGICPFLGVSKKFDQAAGMGLAVSGLVMQTTLNNTMAAPWCYFLVRVTGLEPARINTRS